MTTISVGVIAVVRELLESDLIFFRLAVALPEPMRTRVIGNRSRLNQDVLNIMRMALDPPTQQRFVVHVPLDTAQAGEWSEPVRVTPSVQQLASAMEHDVDTQDGNCAVCQDTVGSGTRLRNCGHVFHRTCITNWFEMSSRCPVCRDDVRVPRASSPPGQAPSA
jgi:hypothetical protein